MSDPVDPTAPQAPQERDAGAPERGEGNAGRPRSVIAMYDERMLAHDPAVEERFLPGRLDRHVRQILAGLVVQWKYPEHPGRLSAVKRLLDAQPVAGVRFEAGRAATTEQLSRVHTTSYLELPPRVARLRRARHARGPGRRRAERARGVRAPRGGRGRRLPSRGLHGAVTRAPHAPAGWRAPLAGAERAG